MLDLSFNQVKKHHFVINLPWCCPGLNWRPFACKEDVITTTPQHLAISSSSSNFISNVGLIRNKMLDLSFNQVKKHHFVKNLPWCCQGLNCRPSACKADVITTTSQHLAISSSSSNFISNVWLIRNQMLDFSFDQVKKTSFCQKLALMLSRLELETFCVLSRRDNRYITAPWD